MRLVRMEPKGFGMGVGMFGVMIDDMVNAATLRDDFPIDDLASAVRVAIDEGVGECPSLTEWARERVDRWGWFVCTSRRGDVRLNDDYMSVEEQANVARWIDMGDDFVCTGDVMPILVSDRVFIGYEYHGDMVMFFF